MTTVCVSRKDRVSSPLRSNCHAQPGVGGVLAVVAAAGVDAALRVGLNAAASPMRRETHTHTPWEAERGEVRCGRDTHTHTPWEAERREER